MEQVKSKGKQNPRPILHLTKKRRQAPNGETQFGRSSSYYPGDDPAEVQVTGCFLPSFLFLPVPLHPPSPQIKRQLRDLWQMPPFQGSAKQTTLFGFDNFYRLEAACPTVCSVFVDIWFSQDKRARALALTRRSEWQRFFAESSFLLYSDIWCPLPEQIRAIPSHVRGRLPVLTAQSGGRTQGLRPRTRQP